MPAQPDIEKQAQELYHAQTRAWSGSAWSWTEASEEVKAKFRAHVLAGTRPALPTDQTF